MFLYSNSNRMKILKKNSHETMTKSRPNQKYIIVAVLADLIIRLTFTGDIGTLFPYLTLEKFSFTRQNYGLLIGVR